MAYFWNNNLVSFVNEAAMKVITGSCKWGNMLHSPTKQSIVKITKDSHEFFSIFCVRQRVPHEKMSKIPEKTSLLLRGLVRTQQGIIVWKKFPQWIMAFDVEIWVGMRQTGSKKNHN